MLKSLLRPFASSGRAWLHRVRVDAEARIRGLWEAWSPEPPEVDLPPPRLRYNVHGALDVESWLRVGRRCAADLTSALGQVGVDRGSDVAVLDFGCGCGRTLSWLRGAMPKARLSGTDIDTGAIDWCRAHLPFVETRVNGAHPPLEYRDSSFDVIYAISVFTHLDEGMQTEWLHELGRVLRETGVLIVTVHGGGHSIDNKGNLNWRGRFPDWYQDTLHNEQYIRENYGRLFEVVRYVPKGMNAHQDLVVLRQHQMRGPAPRTDESAP